MAMEFPIMTTLKPYSPMFLAQQPLGIALGHRTNSTPFAHFVYAEHFRHTFFNSLI